MPQIPHIDVEFEWWFEDLYRIFVDFGAEWAISRNDPESYRGYYEDGYTVDATFNEIMSYWADET